MPKILLIPGDGIGPEVMNEAKRLLTLIEKKLSISIEFDEADWGAERYLRDGTGLPQKAIEEIPKHYNALLFGALGDPRIPDMRHGREILLGLRFGLDLFINFRPIKLFHPTVSVLKNNNPLDWALFRENTQDIYLGLGHSTHQGTPDEIAVDESRHTFAGVYRIIKAAFDYAKRHERKSVTLVDKSNAIQFGGSLWQRVFRGVSKEYPSIQSKHLFVDVAAMKMVMDPAFFDVIVTSNLFGDILSDLGAGLIGGLGLCSSANINSGGLGLFEPVHGSAPDIAGMNKANPCAMFLTVGLMMQHLGYGSVIVSIEEAIKQSIQEGAVTADLGGVLSCHDASTKILHLLQQL